MEAGCCDLEKYCELNKEINRRITKYELVYLFSAISELLFKLN
jgi:hypothetical protein